MGAVAAGMTETKARKAAAIAAEVKCLKTVTVGSLKLTRLADSGEPSQITEFDNAQSAVADFVI
jgi:hypothetical protein